MLQRSVALQKRPLDWTFARCKRLPADTLLQSHRRRSLASVRYALSTQTPPSEPTSRNWQSPPQHSPTANPISKHTSDKLASWTAESSPFPEFAPVMHALALKDPFDRVIETVKSSPPLLDLFSDYKRLREVVLGLANSSDPRRCLEVLDLAHQVGHTLKHGAYEAVALTLANLHQWSLVLYVATTGIQHVGRSTVRLMNWHARALLELQQYRLLQNVLDDFEAVSLVPTLRTYQLVLSGAFRNNDMEGAVRCLQRMDKAGLPLDERTQEMVTTFYQHFGANLKLSQDALDQLSFLESTSAAVASLNSVVLSALNIQDIALAVKLLSLFDAPYVECIISTLPSLNEGQQPSHDLHLPDNITLQPDTQTFVTFMNYHIRSGNYRRAISIAEAALERGLPANAGLVTSLVHAYFLQNRGNIAIELVSRLSDPATQKYFTSLLSHHYAPSPTHTLPDITNVPLSTRICNALLRGILQRQGLRHVPKVFSIMHAHNLRPSTRTLEILVSYLSRTEGVRPRTILAIMQELSTSSFDVSVRHMHHLIQYILREEKRHVVGGGWSSYDRRRENSDTYKGSPERSMSGDMPLDPLGGLSFGSHTGYGISAAPLIESLLNRDVKSDPVMLAMRIRRDALVHGEFASADDAFRTLSDRGMAPNAHHFSALMEGYALIGDMDSACKVLQHAEEAGVIPNAVLFTILIHGYGRKHDTRSAMKTFHEMVKRDIYPDVAAIDAVVGAFFAAGARKAARNHLILLWSYIEPFPDSLQDASLGTLISQFRELDTSRDKVKRTTMSKASVYHQVRRVLASYRRNFTFVENENNKVS